MAWWMLKAGTVNKTKVAKELGITRQALQQRLKTWVELKLSDGRVMLVNPKQMMEKPE